MPLPAVASITRHVHEPDATITLDETARHRRRLRMVSDSTDGKPGIEFMLDLPEARLLRHGDGLVLDDGRVILVRAEPEELYEVRGRDPHHLLRLSWHMGNRHLPAQVMADHVRIRQDHVIRAMLEGLGATVSAVTAPFDPEGGAYGDPASGVAHGHTDGHGHAHHDHHHHGHD